MQRLEIYQKIKVAQLKMTKQRQQIIDVLIEHQDRLLSVEAILKKLNHNSKLNITTIYRNLEALMAIGLLHCTVLEDQMTYYKLNCGGHHHHHLICKKCGAISAVAYCPIEHISQLIADDAFKITDHKLEVYGICKKCQKIKP